MIRQRTAISLLLLVLGLPCLGFGQEEDEAETLEKDAKIQAIQKAAYAELREIFRTQANLTIEDLERFAELKPGALKKCRVLAKKSIDELSQQFGGIVISRIEQFFENALFRRMGALAGTTYSINGKSFTFEGEEKEEPFIAYWLDFSRRMAMLRMEDPRGRSSSSAAGGKGLPFRIEEQKGWEQGVESIGADKLKRYSDFVENRSLRQLKSVVLEILNFELRLTEPQRPLMRKFVESAVSVDDQITMSSNLVKNMTAQKVFKEMPEFLSEVQQRKWKLLASNQQVLGW